MVERHHGFLERRVGIEAVRIEDVDIVEPHPLQALVEAGQHIFAAAPFAVGTGPHQVAGLGRDDQFVAKPAKSVRRISPKALSAEPGGGP